MVLRYQGNFLLSIGAETVAAAEAEEFEELLITIGVSDPLRASTCFPHLGHTTQSISIIWPQNLQYFVSFIILSPFRNRKIVRHVR